MPPGKHRCLRLLSVWQHTVPAAHRLQYGADITCKACGKTSFAVEVGLFTIHRPWRRSTGKSRALPKRQCHAADSEGGGIRTRDLRIKSPLLYLLSYALGAGLDGVAEAGWPFSQSVGPLAYHRSSGRFQQIAFRMLAVIIRPAGVIARQAGFGMQHSEWPEVPGGPVPAATTNATIYQA
jgi:hypothetical protein